MNPTIQQFQYDYANLDLYTLYPTTRHAEDAPSPIIPIIISLVGGILFMILLYLMIRGVMIRSIGWEIDRGIAHKKKTLANLILMKDIQTELEKEIEQAILKAAFHT